MSITLISQGQSDRSRVGVRNFPGFIAGVLTAALILSACNGNDPEPKEPKKSATSKSPQASGPPVSPAPTDVPQLNAEQQKAYDGALARYREYRKFVDRVGEKPAINAEIANEAAKYLVMPATKVFSDSVDQLLEDGTTTSGSRGIEWAVPVTVSTDRVVLRQCESPGNWRIIQGTKSEPQLNNIVTKAEMVYVAKEWRLKQTRGDGEC